MGEKKPFKERRKYIRLKTNVEIRYTIIGKPGEIEVFSKNISAGGLCIIAEEALAADTPLQLEINIPDLKDPIRALGRVVWQKSFESTGKDQIKYFNTGVEFTGISDFDRFNIERFVQEHIETNNLS
jgi:c-di-GMP-binding flagellar brake protein YcgR